MPSFPAPRYLDLPNLRMAVYEQGDGIPVILCHGWPELAYSWRHQIAALADAGYWAIAPDQRGYGATGQPHDDDGSAASVPLYDMQHLCDDLIALLDTLEIEKAVFAGHDWGGIVMWRLPFYYPQRIAGLIGVNTPFIPRLKTDPIDAMRTALGDNMYIVAFQEHGVAEARMEQDVARSLRLLYRKAGGTEDKAPAHKAWENFALLDLLDTDEAEWPGQVLFDKQDFAIYENAFRKTGFRGGINWYRNFSRNWRASANHSDIIDTIPCLMICAENDRVLSPDMAQGMDKYVKDLETHIIKDCGHWTQNEKPQELSALMIDWLKRRIHA